MHGQREVELCGAASAIGSMLNPLRHAGFHLVVAEQSTESGGGVSTRNDSFAEICSPEASVTPVTRSSVLTMAVLTETQLHCGATFLRRGGQRLAQSTHAAHHLRGAGLAQVLTGRPM